MNLKEELKRRDYLTDLSIDDLIEIMRDRYRLETGFECSDEGFIRQALISCIIDTEE